MDDAQGLEIGSNRGVDCMHYDVFNLADTHPTQIDLARGGNVGKVAANGDRHFGRRRRGGGQSQRASRNGKLHHPDRHHRFTITHLHYPSDFSTKRIHFHEVAHTDLGVIPRGPGGPFFASNPIELASLLVGETLYPLPRVARGSLSLLRRRLEVAYRALHFRARLEKIRPCFLS